MYILYFLSIPVFLVPRFTPPLHYRVILSAAVHAITSVVHSNVELTRQNSKAETFIAEVLVSSYLKDKITYHSQPDYLLYKVQSLYLTTVKSEQF